MADLSFQIVKVSGDHLTIQQENGPEVTGVVVGAWGVIGMQDNVAAFVTDQVFVIGSKQEAAAFLEASGAGLVREVLRLHGTHPAHYLPGCGELRADELLAQQALGYWIHTGASFAYEGTDFFPHGKKTLKSPHLY